MTETIEAPSPTAQRAKREREETQHAIAQRLANPCAHPGAEQPTRHTQVTHCLKGGKVSSFCSCYHCTLAVCSQCGAYDGGLTTHCPNELVGEATMRAVYTTKLDYLTDRGWHLSDEDARWRIPLFAATPADGLD